MTRTPDLSEAYVLGLLTDLEARVPEIGRELNVAMRRAAACDDELSTLLVTIGALQVNVETLEDDLNAAVLALSAHNQRLGTLHQEVGVFEHRGEELRAEMANATLDQQRALRRERGQIALEIEDRRELIAGLAAQVEIQRKKVSTSQQALVDAKDRMRQVTRKLDALQDQLPSPYLYIDLFEKACARAHCRFFLDGKHAAWARDLKRAVDLMMQLHKALRDGKYRLDKNSDVVGGRATATAEAICAAVVVMDFGSAVDLFALACDPELFFHQIFEVYRCWLFGLYLTGQTSELLDLLQLHAYSEGLRGGYTTAFLGLVHGDADKIEAGLFDIVRFGFEPYTSMTRTRGLGVINLGALAIAKLAMDNGIAIRGRFVSVPLAALTRPLQ